jgi:dienelactone hydrolase
MDRKIILILDWLLLGCVCGTIQLQAITVEKVVYSERGEKLFGYICKPEKKGPHPAVIYLHGGKGKAVGGAPKETCEALAKLDMVGFAGYRTHRIDLRANIRNASESLDFIKKQPDVDAKRIAVIGFSRGGLLSYFLASTNPDLKALVVMAAAPAPEAVKDHLKLENISAPILLQVSENDTPGNNQENQDHVQLIKSVYAHLKKEGKEVQLIVYPPYKSNGHQLFFQIGEYWNDVAKFLQSHLLD